MEIDNRFYQCETKAGSVGTARRISAVKPIENVRQMFCGDSGTVIVDGNFEIAVVFRNRDTN